MVGANSAKIIKVSLSEGAIASFPEYSLSASPKIASSTGTLMYRDVMSQDISTSSWSTESFDEKFIFNSGITYYQAMIFCASL